MLSTAVTAGGTLLVAKSRSDGGTALGGEGEKDKKTQAFGTLCKEYLPPLGSRRLGSV